MADCLYRINIDGYFQEFSSEEELNNFLRANKRQLVASLLSKETLFSIDATPVKNTVDTVLGMSGMVSKNEVEHRYYVKGEELTSVTKYITTPRIVNGIQKYFVPEFRLQNILAQRKSELQLKIGRDGQPKYTSEEIETILSDLTKGWELSSMLGTSFHKIAEAFFKGEISTSNDVALIVPELDKNDYILNKYIETLTEMKEYITKKHGEDAVFLTEATIYDTNMKIPGMNGLAGTSDLIVVDNKGVAHIYDWKTSTKEEGAWNDTKLNTVKYQLSFYRQILRRAGIKVGTMSYVPIIIRDIDYTNKVIANFEATLPVTIHITSGETIATNIAEVMPYTTLHTLEDVGSNKVVNEFLSKAFNYEQKKVRRGGNSVQEVYDQLLQRVSDDGKSYVLYNIFNRTSTYIPINSSEESIKDKIQTYLLQLDEYNAKLPIEFHDYVYYAKTAKATGKRIETETRWTNDTDTINKLNNLLFKYIDDQAWHPLDSDLMYDLGIVAFENEFTGEVDFISLTANRLTDPVKLIRGNTLLGNVMGDHKALIEGASEKFSVGDIELLKIFALVKNNEETFKDKKIGKMFAVNMQKNKVIPTIHTQTFTALNDQWNLLIKHLPDFALKSTDWDLNEVNSFDTFLEYTTDLFERPDFRFEKRHDEIKKLFDKVDNLADAGEVNEKIEALSRLQNQVLDSVGNIEAIKYDRKDIARMLTLLSEAILQLEGTPITLEEDLKQFGNFIGENANLTMPERFKNPLMRAAVNAVREALNNAGHVFNSKTEHFRSMHEQLYRAKSIGAVQIKTIGYNQPAFVNLMRKVDGKNTFQFKNTETDTTLSAAEKNYINSFLKQVNDIRERRILEKYGEFSVQMEDFKAIGKWNIPLMKTSMFSAFLGKNTKEFVNDYFRDMLNPDKVFDDDVDSSDKLKYQREMFNQFDWLDMNYEKRTEVLSNSKDTDFETDLEAVLAMYLMADAKQVEYNKVMPVINSIKTLAMLSDINWFRPNDNTVNAIENFVGTTLFGKSIVAGESKTAALAAKVTVDVVSMAALAVSPASALTEFFTGQLGGLTRTLANVNHDWLFGKADLLKAIPLVSIDVSSRNKMSLDKINYSDSLNAMFQISEMDIRQMTHEIQSTATGIRNFKSKHMYGLNAIPTYVHRLVLFNAQLIKDGVVKTNGTGFTIDSALQMVNGKMVYYPAKDDRFRLFLMNPTADPSKQSAEWKESRARYNKLVEELGNEPGGLKENGTPARPYDNRTRDSLKSFSDQVFGGYDQDSKTHFGKTAFGQLFMQFKTWVNAKKHRWYSPTDTKGRQGRYVIEYVDGEPVYIWKGKMMEGIIQSFVGLASDLKANKYNFVKSWNELDASTKENFTWMISDLLLFGIMSMIIGLLQQEINKDEDPVANLFTRSLNNGTKDLWIGSSTSAIAGTKNPIAIFGWSANVMNSTWGLMTGDPNAAGDLMSNVGMWRTLSPIFFSGDE